MAVPIPEGIGTVRLGQIGNLIFQLTIKAYGKAVSLFWKLSAKRPQWVARQSLRQRQSTWSQFWAAV